MDFHAHFGLRKTPFTREIAVDEMFVHPQHDQVKRCIARAVQQRMSAALQAPAGFARRRSFARCARSCPRSATTCTTSR